MEKSMYDKVAEAVVNLKTDKPALICLDKSVSYFRLKKLIGDFALGLIRIGLTANDTLTIALPNIPSAAIAFYAASYIGCDINMVHPLLPAKQIVGQAVKTGSRFMIVNDIFYQDLKSGLAAENITAIIASPVDFAGGLIRILYKLKNRKALKACKKALAFKSLIDGTPANAPARGGADFARVKNSRVFLHSGGTSGEPKTIELSEGSFNRLAGRAAEMCAVTKETLFNYRELMLLPMFHGFGLCMCLHAFLIHGAEIVMVPKFEGKSALKAAVKYKTNIIMGVPRLFEKLFAQAVPGKTDLSFMTRLFCGGDTLHTHTAAAADKKLKDCGSDAYLSEGYGLTEAVTVCTVNTVNANRRGSLGRPLSGMRLKAVDENGKELPAGGIGEILLHSDTLMQGYLGDGNATKDTFLIDEDGLKWLRTGDLGYLDKDGYLFFKQRISRTLKINGMNVYPAEVEAAITDSGLVLSAAVAMKDEKLTAFIVLPEKNKDKIVCDREAIKTVETIKEKLKNILPYWSLPKEYIIKKSLPLTPVGKVDYNKL